MTTTTNATMTPATAAGAPLSVADARARFARAAEVVRGRLHEVAPDLSGEVERMEVFAAQQMPGYQTALVLREATRAEAALTDLEDALSAAQALVRDRRAALGEQAQALATAREGLEALAAIDRVEAEERAVATAAVEVEHLAAAVEEVQRWIALARHTTGRLAQAAVTVARRRAVADAAERLTALRARAQALRAAPPDDAAAAAALARLEARLGRPLPVPRLAWPKDVLGDPALAEPERGGR